MTTRVCRVANENDLDFIRQLSSEVFLEYGNYDEIVPAWFSEPDVVTLVILENTEPAGFAMLAVERRGRDQTGSVHVFAIAVSPGQQRSGLGSVLLSRVEEFARKFGVNRVHLNTADVNQQALSFFKKAGYEIIGSAKRFYPKGQSALVMAKELAS